MHVPDNAALVVLLITNRALCLECIAARTKLAFDVVRDYFERIAPDVQLHQDLGTCESCERHSRRFSLAPPD